MLSIHCFGMTENDNKKLSHEPIIVNEYNADILEGEIGSIDQTMDSPHDNVFVVDIETDIVNNYQYSLSYEVFGVQGSEAVSLSINERQSKGGYLIKSKDEWADVLQPLKKDWIGNGKNIFKFTTNKEANYSYKIRNLKVVKQLITEGKTNDQAYFSQVSTIKNNQIYVQGFVPSQITNLFIGDLEVELTNNSFETLYSISEKELNEKLVAVSYIDHQGKKTHTSLIFEAELSKRNKCIYHAFKISGHHASIFRNEQHHKTENSLSIFTAWFKIRKQCTFRNTI